MHVPQPEPPVRGGLGSSVASGTVSGQPGSPLVTLSISDATEPSTASAGLESDGDWLVARVAEGSDYLKIIIDDGCCLGYSRPALDADTVKALIDAAHRHWA